MFLPYKYRLPLCKGIDGGIQKQFPQLCLQTEYPVDVIQDSVSNPFTEPAVYGLPEAITFWKVTPGGTTPVTIGGCLSYVMSSRGFQLQ